MSKTCSACRTRVQRGNCASGASYGFGRVDAGVHGEARGLPHGELPHCETARYKSTFFHDGKPRSFNATPSIALLWNHCMEIDLLYDEQHKDENEDVGDRMRDGLV